MANMEGECQESGTTEDIPVVLLDSNSNLKRPKNFSSQRRSNVYYFSDNSGRGILKRVPVKNGYYRMNELQTVLENPDAAKIRHGITSDGPLNSRGNSKAGKKYTASRSDDSSASECQKRTAVSKSRNETAGIAHLPHGWHTASRSDDLSASEYQKRKAVSKSRNETPGIAHLPHGWHIASRSDDSSALKYQNRKAVSKSGNETAGIDHLSHGLEKLVIRKTSEDSKTTNSDLKPSKMINQHSNKESLYVPSKRHRKKKYQLNVSLPTASKMLEVCASDEKNEKLSASGMKRVSSLNKPDDPKDNHKSLSETWTERNLNDALNMSEIMKTPISEL